MAKSKSKGGAPKGPSSQEPNQLENDLKGSGERSAGDPQEAHEEHMQGDDQLEPDGPDADQPDPNGETYTREEDDNDDPVNVRVVPDRQAINGHVCKAGTVTKMRPSDIKKHRQAGVPMEDVPDDYDGEIVDTSEPYVAEEKAEA